MELLPEHPQVLAFVRSHQGERVLCAFNLGDRSAELELRAGDSLVGKLDDSGAGGATIDGTRVRFEPFGVLFARLGAS